MGDFNDTCLKWDSSHDKSDLKNDFYDLINLSDMVQLVTEPTHFTDHSESLIDLVITDSPGFVKSIYMYLLLWDRITSHYMWNSRSHILEIELCKTHLGLLKRGLTD